MTAPVMTAPATRVRATLVLLAGAAVLAGCAPAASHAAASHPAARKALTAPLVTSMTAANGATWAVVAMGGSAADEDQFWELFTRPPGSTSWKLVTPPGVADNGGLVAAGSSGPLTVAFQPSQDLTFSPLASSGNGGKTWGVGLLDAAVASVPDALATNTAGSSGMLALLDNGAIDQAAGQPAASGSAASQSSGNQDGWTALAAPGAIAASAAGRRCQVTGWTGVAYTPSGTPLAAASCARPGTVGIFADVAGSWQASGPADPGGQPLRVIRLSQTPAGDTALLQAEGRGEASLLGGWTSDGTRWTASPSLPLHGGHVQASGTGPGGMLWVLLSGDRAETLDGPGASWRDLPAPPRGTAALAAGPDGTDEALAVSGARLTVYQLTAAGTWDKAQVISVPIQFGSSS
ncbi:MAG TPA: hypothetical protein VI365_34660 [Trebonia sp.]